MKQGKTREKKEAVKSNKSSAKVPIKVEVEKGKDVQAKRLEFIKANTETIVKSWSELKMKSANALERVLPHEWKSEWIEEVLHLLDLRTSGYKTIQAAAEADRPLLDGGKK